MTEVNPVFSWNAETRLGDLQRRRLGFDALIAASAACILGALFVKNRHLGKACVSVGLGGGFVGWMGRRILADEIRLEKPVAELADDVQAVLDKGEKVPLLADPFRTNSSVQGDTYKEERLMIESITDQGNLSDVQWNALQKRLVGHMFGSAEEQDLDIRRQHRYWIAFLAELARNPSCMDSFEAASSRVHGGGFFNEIHREMWPSRQAD